MNSSASPCQVEHIARDILMTEASKRFSGSQIADELVRRGALIKCDCGILFRDQPMYYLHKSQHNEKNPLACSNEKCNFVASDYKEFMVHFFKHK